MSRVCSLASSSSGNSTYIASADTAVLVDAGISCRAMMNGLKSEGLALEKLKAILLTHEHIDHVKGLPIFLKKLPLPIFASEAVLTYIQNNLDLPAGTKLCPLEDDGMEIDDLYVRSFVTPHDSVGSRGYRFSMSDGIDIGYATDLGCFTAEVRNGLSGCHAVVLESNYDDNMLDFGGYPRYLKDRIRCQRGHLSNIDCAEAAWYLAEHGTAHFLLAHLSQENNAPALAKVTTVSRLISQGMKAEVDFTLEVAPKAASKMMIF